MPRGRPPKKAVEPVAAAPSRKRRASEDEPKATKKAKVEEPKNAKVKKPKTSKVEAPKKAEGEESKYASLKKSNLLDLVKQYGLVTTGNKPELIERLQQHEENPDAVPKAKTRRSASAAAAGPVNVIPTTPLELFIFGEGESGELGFGNRRNGKDAPAGVTRPRAHHLLDPDTVGVVAFAAGGMHSAVITKDNKILTWGVNDGGALGRDTEEGIKMVDIDGASDGSGDGDSTTGEAWEDLNPIECAPQAVDSKHFTPGTKFANIACSDSATFAITDEGVLWGWGEFRDNQGPIGFLPAPVLGKDEIRPKDFHNPKEQYPVCLSKTLPGLEGKQIVQITCGTNHVIAVDSKGTAYSWGSTDQNQNGRRTVDRHGLGLIPYTLFGIGKKPKVVAIGAGDYHSFAITDDGNVHGWGLNTYGETLHPVSSENNGCLGAGLKASIVKGLKAYPRIKKITGGAHHSMALTEDGQVLIWGRMEDRQVGVPLEDIPEDTIVYNDKDEPCYVTKPVHVTKVWSSVREKVGREGDLLDYKLVGVDISCGPDNCIAVGDNGRAYAWGYGENYVTGLGTTETAERARWICNKAVDDKIITMCDSGGQFGILAHDPDVEREDD